MAWGSGEGFIGGGGFLSIGCYVTFPASSALLHLGQVQPPGVRPPGSEGHAGEVSPYRRGIQLPVALRTIPLLLSEIIPHGAEVCGPLLHLCGAAAAGERVGTHRCGGAAGPWTGVGECRGVLP